jgi:hypothetical protein
MRDIRKAPKGEKWPRRGMGAVCVLRKVSRQVTKSCDEARSC